MFISQFYQLISRYIHNRYLAKNAIFLLHLLLEHDSYLIKSQLLFFLFIQNYLRHFNFSIIISFEKFLERY